MTRSFVWLSALVSIGWLGLIGGCAKPSASAGDSKPSGAKAAAKTDSPGQTLTTAEAVLDKMAAAYKNAKSYEDFATVELREEGVPGEPQRANFSVAVERPNKLRMKLYDGEVVCDGKQWYAFSKLIPNQAMLREAPAKLTLNQLQVDNVIGQTLNNGFGGSSPQFLLLFEDQPLNTLLANATEVVLDEPGRIGDYLCYRVRFTRADGVGELWIDQKTFVMRQMNFRMTPTPQPGETPPPPITLTANFERARLDPEINPVAFQFEIPPGVERRRALMFPNPNDLLGKQLPDFKLTDMQGKDWSNQSLEGKIGVLHFWRANDESCKAVVPSLQELYAKFKDNDKVVIRAVNIDDSKPDAKTIEAEAKKLGLPMPLLHDRETEAARFLKLPPPPATLFIDAKGTLQDCIQGGNPVAAMAATRKVERLLAGENLAKKAQEEYRQQCQTNETQVDLAFSDQAQTITVEQVQAKIAAKSPPAKLRLTRLWQCPLANPAGNLLVVATSGDKPRILVIDGYKAISEIGLEGKVKGTHKAKLADEEIYTLRTGVGRDGKRYFAAFAPARQQFHLFDENLNHILNYPDDALANTHAGIADVELSDLDGDGVLKAYVGYHGVVGVQCASLDGHRQWSCRNILNVTRVVPGPPDAQQHRELYCVNDAISIATIDAKGKLRDAARSPGEASMYFLTLADLTGNGPQWCGITFDPTPQQPLMGRFTAVGLGTHGEMQWKYALPSGTQQAVEAIVVGRLLPGAASQWIFPASDGSIHIVAADGTPIDHFNYGAQINGVAVAEIDGKPALLISSQSGIEALRVE